MGSLSRDPIFAMHNAAQVHAEAAAREVKQDIAEAARSLADDYDMVGTQDAEWMATAWRRFAKKLDPGGAE